MSIINFKKGKIENYQSIYHSRKNVKNIPNSLSNKSQGITGALLSAT